MKVISLPWNNRHDEQSMLDALSQGSVSALIADGPWVAYQAATNCQFTQVDLSSALNHELLNYSLHRSCASTQASDVSFSTLVEPLLHYVLFPNSTPYSEIMVFDLFLNQLLINGVQVMSLLLITRRNVFHFP